MDSTLAGFGLAITIAISVFFYKSKEYFSHIEGDQTAHVQTTESQLAETQLALALSQDQLIKLKSHLVTSVGVDINSKIKQIG
jgi:hypothetical protein